MAGPADPARSGIGVPMRVPLLALGFVALVIGVGAGLVRLGIVVPVIAAVAAPNHAMLMIGGFFGVVIALERAVAIGRAWAYAAPLAAGAGAIAAIAGANALAPWLLLAASAVLTIVCADIYRRQCAAFTATIALGALAWLGGNLAWALGAPVQQVVTWWLAFPILTIAGERLELSRLLPRSAAAQRMFSAIVVALAVALAAAAMPWGARVFGASLLALAAWLAMHDLARRTVRGRTLTRYIAICLLSGYVWLAIGALIALVAGLVPGTRAYDAALHALGLGFVFSMVFGHAPIVVPAVLRVDVGYRRAFYVPLALLHATLALRLAGDALTDPVWTRAGGIGNAVALAAFILTMAASAWLTKRAGAARDDRAVLK